MKLDRKARILVIDDEENIRKSLKMILEYDGYIFYEAADGESGLQAIDEIPGLDLVLLDIHLPGRDGLEILKEIRNRPFPPEVVMISGQGTVQTAVEATKLGAFEFLEKPLHRDRILLTLRNALDRNKLARENLDLRRKAEKRYELVGNHPLMKKLWRDIQAVAPTNATVLIFGESGTGKELIARAVHARSLRAKEAFIQVNCAAIPEELIESELFGHEKGAFTGATEKKPGKFELADGGTIFLDEVGDMSLKTQSKVLRVLEEGEVQKVGSNKISKVDVRVIAATNKDLKEEVEMGRFRGDLFFRLNVVNVKVPPLRERRSDIPFLVAHFVGKYSRKLDRKIKEVDPEAMRVLYSYNWPGNVRELENVIESALVMSRGSTVKKSDLPSELRTHGQIFEETETLISMDSGLMDTLDAIEAKMIRQALKQSGNVQAQAAKILGISRSNLQYKLKKYGIHSE